MAVAWLTLLWERLLPSLWPLFGLAGVFVALAFFDVLPLLPWWLHAALLLVLALLFVGFLWRALPSLRLPKRAQVLRRIEVDSGLRHRPLQSLEDILPPEQRQATQRDLESFALWRQHQAWLRNQARNLKFSLPRPLLQKADPYALRVVLLLLIGVAGVGAWGDWQNRLWRAATPGLAMAATEGAVALDLWVAPPDYTGLPPLFLTESRRNPQDGSAEGARPGPTVVPQGSRVFARLSGGDRQPSLLIDDQETAFSLASPGLFKVEASLDQIAERLSVRLGGNELRSWDLEVVADQPPEIAFTRPPGRSERFALRLDYLARDDYGLTKGHAEIRRLDQPEAEPLVVELLLPGGNRPEVQGKSFHDLTYHTWAGLAVEITLEVEDGFGQTARSQPERGVLPERLFSHPVAQALVELRRRLLHETGAEEEVRRSLAGILSFPQAYFNDTTVTLGLIFAVRRLGRPLDADAREQLQRLLWDMALHLEDGEVALAERDLRDAQQALLEALARDAENSEIQSLIDALQDAMDKFLEALAKQMMEEMARGEQPQELPPDANLLETQDLQDLLDQARRLAESGAMDAAKELLAQLQEILENLRAQPLAQRGNQDTGQAQHMLEQMEGLTRQQQDLLDRNFRRSQEQNRNFDQGDDSEQMRRQQADQHSRESREDAQRQERLRRELGEMMRRLGEVLGEIPKPMGRAERAMRDARDALATDRSGDALPPQQRAVDQLQQGMEAMVERFMQQMGESEDQGSGPLGARAGEGRDPFGRETGREGLEALEGVSIPEEADVQRSREIRDELRRRRANPDRPPVELDYIDRLLKRF
jgi:uncharacterized protein (TIGR02302 family)